MARISVRVLWAVFVALFLTACNDIDFGSSDRFKEDFHYTYPLPAGGRLALENFNGSIEITGWEKDSVEINGTKFASTQDRLNDIKISVTSGPNEVRIQTTCPNYRSGNMGARYVIRVPRKVVLDRIVSSNGSLRVEDVQGEVRVRTSNGSIRTSRIQGELDAETSNGSIDVTNVVGNARVHTSNGSIRADISKGAFEATTSNSSITARLTEPDPDHAVRLGSSNGHIDLTMDAPREVRANTSNSSITVHLPPDLNARLNAHTSNSTITSDFDVTVRGGTLSKHTLEGTLGHGGPLIDLETLNGSIKILKM